MGAAKKRVLFLLGADAPSSRVRATIYEEPLRRSYEARFEALYLPSLSAWRRRAAGLRPWLLARLATAPFDAAILAVKAVSARRVLASAAGFDGIVLIKYFDGAFVRALRSRTKAKLLYDLDDAAWLPEFLGPGQFEQVVREVDAVSCDNGFLLSRVAPLNANSFVLRGPARSINSAPRAPRPVGAPVVICWVGSPSTLHYLRLVAGPLERLARDVGEKIVFRVVGAGHDRSRLPSIPGLRMECIAEYDEAEMVRQLGEADVGLFPLNDDDNSLGRGILKATLYMGAGVPAVCSAVGELPSFLHHGKDGFVCASSNDWYEALLRLVNDPSLRQSVGEAGRRKVQAEFSLEACYSVLEERFLSQL